MKEAARIYLIGLPGVGKTTLGINLASRMGCPFFDMDHLLQFSTGMMIPDLFKQYGEPYFRDRESSTLETLSRYPAACVVATGGGIVLRPENRRILHESGTVVYLDRSPSAILGTLTVQDRPMMRNDPARLWTLNKERAPLYSNCCHIHVHLEGGLDESLDQLQSHLAIAV